METRKPASPKTGSGERGEYKTSVQLQQAHFLHSNFDLNISALVNVYLYEIQNFVIKVFYFSDILYDEVYPAIISSAPHKYHPRRLL